MPAFTLRKDQEGGEFSKKMDTIFGNLTALEAKHQEWEHSNSEENESFVKSDPVLEDPVNSTSSRLSRSNNFARLVSQTNDFKAPFPSPFNRKRSHETTSSQWNKPDFRKNPDKWTKYTLSDVSDYEMSDKANTSAAMSFLAERKKLKLDEEEKNAEKIEFNKPTFRKPKRNECSETTNKVEEEEKMDVAGGSGLKKTAIVMPEYVVGKGVQKSKKKDKKIRKITMENDDMEEEKTENEELIITPKKPIVLCHLEDEAEDSDS